VWVLYVRRYANNRDDSKTCSSSNGLVAQTDSDANVRVCWINADKGVDLTALRISVRTIEQIIDEKQKHQAQSTEC
jgi:hypothetical protein